MKPAFSTALTNRAHSPGAMGSSSLDVDHREMRVRRRDRQTVGAQPFQVDSL
jgi:hypothetical protein